MKFSNARLEISYKEHFHLTKGLCTEAGFIHLFINPAQRGAKVICLKFICSMHKNANFEKSDANKFVPLIWCNTNEIHYQNCLYLINRELFDGGPCDCVLVHGVGQVDQIILHTVHKVLTKISKFGYENITL